MNSTQTAKTDRLYVLDLLRFLAAAMVVGYHVLVDNGRLWGTKVYDTLGPEIPDFFKYGWIGVEFFFVISGFVICMSSWGRSVPQFVTSRVTRLMPAYLVAVLFTGTILTIWPLAEGRPEPSHVIINLTMVQQLLGVPSIDNVYWTLLVELKFYLIFLGVVALGVTYRRVVIFCAAWLVASLFAMSTNSALLTALVEPRFAPYFVIGIVLYLIYRFRANLILWGILFMAGAMALRSLISRVAAFNVGRHIIDIEVAVAMIAVFLLIVFAAAFHRLDWVRWRGLVVLGALTYPLYLMHMRLSRVMLSQFGGRLAFPVMLAFILVTVLTLAYLMNILVEKPMSRVLRRHLHAGFKAIASADSPAKASQEGPESRRPLAGAPVAHAPAAEHAGGDAGPAPRRDAVDDAALLEDTMFLVQVQEPRHDTQQPIPAARRAMDQA